MSHGWMEVSLPAAGKLQLFVDELVDGEDVLHAPGHPLYLSRLSKNRRSTRRYSSPPTR